MQFQVPQFIETEDKVVGPLSIRQFIYIGAAAVASGMCYFLLQTWLFVIFAILLLGGAFAVSFVKIEGRVLIDVITSAANFYWKPQTYIWKPDHTPAALRRPEEQQGMSALESILAESPLHKTWENLQTGSPEVQKNSDKQFLEGKMAERYQIFQRKTGDRDAARRIDYR